MGQSYFSPDKMLPEIVYIDDRTGSKEFQSELKQRFALKTSLVHLEGADFAMMGNGPRGPMKIGVERKTLSDMVGSMLKNRLTGRQIPIMLNDYDIVYLLLEGEFRPSETSEAIEIPVWARDRQTGKSKRVWVDARLGVTHPQLERWLLGFELQGNGRILNKRTTSKLHTVNFVNDLARYIWKPWSKHSSVGVIGKWKPNEVHQKVMLIKPTDIIRVAAALPGVGSEPARRAGRLAKSIGTMIVSWEAEDWVKAGLTKGRAEKLVFEIWRRAN